MFAIVPLIGDDIHQHRVAAVGMLDVSQFIHARKMLEASPARQSNAEDGGRPAR